MLARGARGYLRGMSTGRVVLSFVGIGLVAALILGFAAWKRAPEAPPPATSSARSLGAVSRPTTPQLPAEKPCLAAPTDAAEDEMVASAGLDADQVRPVMRAAIQSTLSCFAGSPEVTLMLAIHVKCSGRVSAVDIEDAGSASAEVQDCVRERLKYAAFPAHALPDGDVVSYPLTYTPPAPN